MRFIRYLGMVIACTINFLSVYAETIPAISVISTKIDVAYTLNNDRSIMEKTWQDVCRAIDLPPTDVPGGWWCVNHAGNPVYVMAGDVCTDGSFKIPIDSGWCEAPVPSCPNSSWTLSEDKKTCSRPDFSCIINTETVTEEKLLAAIAYGESSTRDSFEEMAAIAYATIRRRDAARVSSVNKLIKKYRSFSYVINDGNPRYRKLMCSESDVSFAKAYMAAKNALDKGFDYANGGCFWDGYDLKTSGSHHRKYLDGFKFTSQGHNILAVQEPVPYEKTTKRGSYTHIYDSTAAYGGTIFWKLNKDFLKAREAGQCL
jgi:hypothetical protein